MFEAESQDSNSMEEQEGVGKGLLRPFQVIPLFGIPLTTRGLTLPLSKPSIRAHLRPEVRSNSN
jgi:hypothetical protein